MKKITALLCAALLCLSALAGCRGPEDETLADETLDVESESETTVETEPETEEETEAGPAPAPEYAEPAWTIEEPATKLNSLTIGGRSIEEYTIVYAKSRYASAIKRFKDNGQDMDGYFPEYDFDKENAEKLAQLIYAYTGVQLPVYEDISFEETEYEILVGATNRSATLELTLKAQEDDQYLITNYGTKFIICGIECGVTWHALDTLEQIFRDSVNAGHTEFDFEADYSYRGEYRLLRIACIGDSITEGVGASNTYLNYVAHMTRYLWKDAKIINCGHSGTTMRDDLLLAYVDCNRYPKALDNAPEVDIFTIMLGTNDGDRDTSAWGEEQDRYFIDCCKFIMQSLQDLNPDLRFVVAKSPDCFNQKTLASCEHVRELTESMIPELNASGFKTDFVDIYAVTAGHAEWFPDTIHPNNDGHMAIGTAWANRLNEVIAEMQAE